MLWHGGFHHHMKNQHATGASVQVLAAPLPRKLPEKEGLEKQQRTTVLVVAPLHPLRELKAAVFWLCLAQPQALQPSGEWTSERKLVLSGNLPLKWTNLHNKRKWKMLRHYKYILCRYACDGFPIFNASQNSFILPEHAVAWLFHWTGYNKCLVSYE